MILLAVSRAGKDLEGTVCSGWAPTQLLASLLPTAPGQQGEEIRTRKARKLIHRDKDSLTREGKREKQKRKWFIGNHSSPPISTPMPSRSLRNSCLGRWSPPPIRYPGFIAEHDAMMYGMGCPFAQSGPAVQAVSPPSSLATPGLLAGVGTQREEPWHCASAIQQQPKHCRVVSAVLATSPKHSTMQAALRKVDSIPARPS